MRQLLGLLVLAAICTIPIANAANISEDMVALDRACIPVLVLVQEGRPELALKAVRALRDSWMAFKQQHYKIITKDADWQKDLDRVDALVWEAYTLIDGGRQISLAQEPLERINVIMANLRHRNQIDHYFDRVLAFREPLNVIVRAARSEPPAANVVELIRTSFAAATTAWARVLATDPGAGYRLSMQEHEVLRAKLELETAALDSLGKALAANDRTAIIAAAIAAWPPFIGIYNSFGDFHALMWAGQ
jgi:hypothetical protein